MVKEAMSKKAALVDLRAVPRLRCRPGRDRAAAAPTVVDVRAVAVRDRCLLLGVPGLATLAVRSPRASLADRIGARRCTLIAGAVLALACVAQATPSLAALLIGRALFGVAFGVVWTTGVAWLAEIDAEHGGSRIGPSVTCASVGMMLGPAVGGVLAGTGATGLPFLLIAAASALVMVPLTLGAGARTFATRRVAAARSRPSWPARCAIRGRRTRLAASVTSRPAELAHAVGYSEAAQAASCSATASPCPTPATAGCASWRRRCAAPESWPRPARSSSRARSRASASC